MPLLILVLLTVIQFAVWLNAAHTAQAIADRALEAARVQGSTDGRGADAARLLFQAVGRETVLGPGVSVTRGGGLVRVRITGHAQHILPFLPMAIDVTAAGPPEAFTAK